MPPTWPNVLATVTPAWFTVCMGTGAMQQVLINFPYPQSGSPGWMRNLGYCFWILDIILFVVLTLIVSCQWTLRRGSLRKTIVNFPSCSYLGAIPIALDTIIQGLTSYYGSNHHGKWATFVLFWINVVLTLAIFFGLLLFQMTSQDERHIDDVAGIWLMTAVPVVIIAATGAEMSRSFTPRINMLLVITSFLLWSAGLVLVHFILICYFWRLVSKHLPPVHFLPSGFLPLAPLSQAATAALDLCVALSSYLQNTLFTPTMSTPPPLPQSTIWAVGEALHFFGILIALFMLAHASFWAVQNAAAMVAKPPKKFEVGMWSLTFPIMSYTVAWGSLGSDLRNNGMRGFAAALTVLCIILWMACAVLTVWNGLLTGKMFVPADPLQPDRDHEDGLRRFDSTQTMSRESKEANGRGRGQDLLSGLPRSV